MYSLLFQLPRILWPTIGQDGVAQTIEQFFCVVMAHGFVSPPADVKPHGLIRVDARLIYGLAVEAGLVSASPNALVPE